MVRNGCLNYLKHQALTSGRQIEAPSHIDGAEDLYMSDLAGLAASSDSDTLYHELERQIAQVLDTLPPRCREIFTMSRFEGLKNREIADRLDISVKVVEKHIGRALAAFRTHLRSTHPSLMLVAWILAMA